MRLFLRSNHPSAASLPVTVHVDGEKVQEIVGDAVKRQLDPLQKAFAAIILHYCNGEARLTEDFLLGLPDTLRIESHRDPRDGSLIIRAHR